MKAVYLKVRLMAIAWLSACLVACTSNVEADLEVIEYPIAFQASLTDIYGTVSDAQGMGDSRLWGWYLTEDSPVPIFEGDKVTDGTWAYEGGRRYWTMEKIHRFYAVSPVYPLEGSGTRVSVTADGVISVADFDCSRTGDEAVDLMTALVGWARYEAEEKPEKVGLEFRHELAQLQIIIKTDQGVTATIHDASFYDIAVKGTLEQDSGESSWKPAAVVGKADTPFQKKIERVLKPVSQLSLFDKMLLIPQDCMKIKLAVNYTRNGENLTETIDFYDLISYLSVGQNYRIELTIGADTITYRASIINKW